MLLLIPLFVLAAVFGAALTLWLGRSRSKHDRRVPASSPVGGAKDGLRAALATARIGEWSWNDATGEVIWDENVATLCGIDRSQSAHDLDGWLALIHHDDRAMFMETLTRSVVAREPIRLDLRCDWADGSVHWLEVVGDVSDTAIGAFGLVIDVDDRHLEIQERTRLIEFERRQRRRVEYLASVNDVLTLSVDTDEILDRITQSVILEHADWCSITLAIDRPRTRPSIRVSHRDPAMVLWAKEVQLSYPYDPDARWGAARVIATKRREFIPRIDQGAFALQGGEVLAKSGAASVVTVPLVGAVGTLGALQLIRSADVPAFTAADLEFIDDLASRLGAALNTAVLFERQSRGRAALETLQRVNGRIASLARVDDVAHAALTYGALGIRSDGGALLLVDESGLTIKETIDSPLGRGADWTDAICRTARDAVDAQTTVFSTFDGPSSQYSVVGIPLQIMNRVIGAVVFSFADCRELSAEEMSMLATLGSRCAGAMERASLYERERTIALTLQHRLLSSLPPTPDWIDAAACYVPASGLEIGGDWFQILDAGEGRIVAIIGDAVGHALSAAAAMGQLRASIATAVANDPDPVNALAAVDVFAGRGADTEAASMALILFQPDGLAHYASAGHPPIVVAPANEAARLVETGRGPLLGFRGDRRYASETLKLLDGDVVVMYTDGLVERRGEPFDDGLDHLLEAVEGCKHLCAQDICDSLIARLGAQGQPIDDVAVLVLRRRSGPEGGA